jgi:hypothetical protein
MKIQTVELKDLEIVELEGEFKVVTRNETTVPCYITNYATKMGKDLGLIETSLLQGVFKLKGLMGANSEANQDVDVSALSEMDELEMQKVIYLGCLGANKDFSDDFDTFLKRYHYSLEETVQLYAELITNLTSSNKNNFATNLQKSTKSRSKKK